MPPQQPAPSSRIKWNEVTWYSKLGALILFLGIVPALCFYMGEQYELTQNSIVNQPTTTISPVTVVQPDGSADATSPGAPKEFIITIEKSIQESASIDPQYLDVSSPTPTITGTVSSDGAAVFVSTSTLPSQYTLQDQPNNLVWSNETDHGATLDVEGQRFFGMTDPLPVGKYYIGIYSVASHYHENPSYFEGNTYTLLASSTMTIQDADRYGLPL